MSAFHLETMIDSMTLPDVLELIADICDEKAEHIQASYAIRPDVLDPQSRDWKRRAKLVRKCAGDCS